MSSYYRLPTPGRKIAHPVAAFLQSLWVWSVYTACMGALVYMLMIAGL